MTTEVHNWPAFTYNLIQEYRKNGVLQAGSTFTPKDFGTDQLSSVMNPDFRVQISKHQDATTAYLKRKASSFQPCVASGVINVSGSTDTYYGRLNVMPSVLAGPVDQTASVPSSLVGSQSRALKSLKNKLSDKERRFQSIIPVAEMRDMHTTYQSMCRLTTSFLNSFISFRRGLKNPKQALANLIDFSSSAWLTYSFGIAPTMSDFEGLAEAVTERLTAHSRTIKEVGGCSTQLIGNNQTQSIYLGGDFSQPSTKTVSVRIRGAYVYDVLFIYSAGRFLNFESANGGVNVQSQFQTGILDVVPAIYELIPYSWLVDYFTSAGDVINDVFTSDYGSTIYNCETRISKWKLQASAALVPTSKASGGSIIQQPKAEGIDIRRLKLANLPHQSLRFKTADEISTNAGNRLANLFSLAAPMVVRPLRRS